jgi:hypothetical protein
VNMYSKVNFADLRLLDSCFGLVSELKTGYGWWQLLFDVRCVSSYHGSGTYSAVFFHNFIIFSFFFQMIGRYHSRTSPTLNGLVLAPRELSLWAGRQMDPLAEANGANVFCFLSSLPRLPPSHHGSVWVWVLPVISL